MGTNEGTATSSDHLRASHAYPNENKNKIKEHPSRRTGQNKHLRKQKSQFFTFRAGLRFSPSMMFVRTSQFLTASSFTFRAELRFSPSMMFVRNISSCAASSVVTPKRHRSSGGLCTVLSFHAKSTSKLRLLFLEFDQVTPIPLRKMERTRGSCRLSAIKVARLKSW